MEGKEENCIPGAYWATRVGAGKGRIPAKTITDRAQERAEAALWKAGTALRGDCVSVVIRKLWKAQSLPYLLSNPHLHGAGRRRPLPRHWREPRWPAPVSGQGREGWGPLTEEKTGSVRGGCVPRGLLCSCADSFCPPHSPGQLQGS